MKTSGTIILTFLAAFAAAHDDIYELCNENNCFAKPPEGGDVATCLTDKNCEVIVTWEKSDTGVVFELEAQFEGAGDGEHWVGVGLSEDGGRSMGNDAVVACYDGTVGNYWNRVEPFYSVPVDGSGFTDGLTQAEVELEANIIHCHFNRDAVTVITTPVEIPEDVTIDLENKQYFVEIASGKLKEGFVSPHSKTGAAVTEEAVNFQA